ncbi:GGDEF domain-containing protein [Kineobactrum salinum]|uniref:diguanylate cyclase n=1 Tax=Kineobactrum salinum TaxID=2708301 RepID=A0A6C0TZG9_9GAMM|nr:GGDEF domain-containing protein [Kineobactrum salinum]QIB65220.1 GGDEF domain-containing protein [Kineobactrum salinum]
MDTQLETLHQLARPHRRAVLVVLLWITIAGGIFFGSLNFYRGAYPIAVTEFLMTGYSGYLLYAVRHTRLLERWILAYLLPFLVAMMIALWTPQASATVFGWVLLIPLVSHLLLGRRLGLLISLVFMAIAAVIFLLRNHHDPELMDIRSIANMVVLSICLIAFSHAYEISRERSELQLLQAARTDFLTGLANRAGLTVFFHREQKRALREQQPLALLVIDLDYFKRVNDQFGHEAGDRALVHAAELMQRRLRSTDLLARLGGEEFGAVLVNTTSTTATEVAEELRLAVAAGKLVHESQPIALTMSIGVAQLGVDGDNLQALLSAADERLYLAKDLGRNRVISAPQTGPDTVPVWQARPSIF